MNCIHQISVIKTVTNEVLKPKLCLKACEITTQGLKNIIFV